MDIRDQLMKLAITDDKELFKFLVKIRTNYINNEAAIEKFSKRGVKALSEVLKKRSELNLSQENGKIIEVALSILGNCTFNNSHAAHQANEADIAKTVISITNNTEDASIQSRACRLIGNLAQQPKIAVNLQQNGVALCLSNCIADDANLQVLALAVRAMRLMWSLKRFRHQILAFGTILKVVMCLYKSLKIEETMNEEEEESEKSELVVLKRGDEPDRCISKDKLEKIIEREMELQTQTNFEYRPAGKRKRIEFCTSSTTKDLTTAILKFLLTITASSMPQVARGIFADAFGFKVLLFLTTEIPFRLMALKILSTFAYNITTQEFLRSSGSDVITEICELLLKSSKSLAASEQKCALAVICLPAENACTRLKLRRSGIFKVFLEIAAKSRCEEELNLLIFAFFQFRFDEVGLEDLMRLNLVNVLIKILTDLVTTMDVDHVTNDDPALDDEKPNLTSKKRLNGENLNFSQKYPRFENYRPSSPILSATSPGSSGYGSGNAQTSPSTSGYSPFGSPVRRYHDYDSDSNQYSPVCSDNEEDLDRLESKVEKIMANSNLEIENSNKSLNCEPNIFRFKNDKNQTFETVKEIRDFTSANLNLELKSNSNFSLQTGSSQMHHKNSNNLKIDSNSIVSQHLNNSTNEFLSFKSDLIHESGENSSNLIVNRDCFIENEECEQESPKDDFDILKFIYENDEIGKSSKRKKKDFEEGSKFGKKMRNCENNPSTDPQSDDEKTPSENSPKSKKSDNFPEALQKIEDDKLHFILLLIWKVSLKYSDASAFTHPNNLKTLVEVCRRVKKPNGKIYQILQNVVEQTRNFVAIFLKQNLIFDISSLGGVDKSHKNCFSCAKMKLISRQLLMDFAKVAESGYGQGEIIHGLLTGDEEFKKLTAVKVLFVISNQEILNKLLFHYRALEIVFEVIFGEKSDISAAACEGISILAENLGIKVPVDDETLANIIPDEFEEQRVNTSIEGDAVKFLVKDGEVMMERKVLIESSEVFSSMLNSDFRESNLNEVHFPTYTVAGMRYFSHLLHLLKMKTLKSIAPRVNDMEILLQSFELATLYFTDLQQPLLNVIKNVISELNVLKVFEWSLVNVNQDLLISSICCFLSAKVDGEAKLKLFKAANEGRFSSEWRNLIVDSISMKCRASDF